MKAYIDVDAARGIGFFADVVSEQDYHEGGPFARSHRTPVCAERGTAEDKAREWAAKHGYTIATVDEVAA